jgi:hypothetical protein
MGLSIGQCLNNGLLLLLRPRLNNISGRTIRLPTGQIIRRLLGRTIRLLPGRNGYNRSDHHHKGLNMKMDSILVTFIND